MELKSFLVNTLQQFDIELVDPNASAAFMLEAGVNQPKEHAKFRFKRVNGAASPVFAKNADWWTPPREKSKSRMVVS